jgi:hypothetical protein
MTECPHCCNLAFIKNNIHFKYIFIFNTSTPFARDAFFS